MPTNSPAGEARITWLKIEEPYYGVGPAGVTIERHDQALSDARKIIRIDNRDFIDAYGRKCVT